MLLGPGLGDAEREAKFYADVRLFIDEGRPVAAALDACLCTDDELRKYRAAWADEEERQASENGPFRFDIGARVECGSTSASKTPTPSNRTGL